MRDADQEQMVGVREVEVEVLVIREEGLSRGAVPETNCFRPVSDVMRQDVSQRGARPGEAAGVLLKVEARGPRQLRLSQASFQPAVSLELVEARTFDQRSQLLEYIPAVLERPPGA